MFNYVLTIMLTSNPTYFDFDLSSSNDIIIHRIGNLLYHIFYKHKMSAPNHLFARYHLIINNHNLDTVCSFYGIPLDQNVPHHRMVLSLNIDEAIKILF